MENDEELLQRTTTLETTKEAVQEAFSKQSWWRRGLWQAPRLMVDDSGGPAEVVLVLISGCHTVL